MSTIKFSHRQINKAGFWIQNAHMYQEALDKAESIAPVNVHSHGKAIEGLITSLQEALRLVEIFQREVQGR